MKNGNSCISETACAMIFVKIKLRTTCVFVFIYIIIYENWII